MEVRIKSNRAAGICIVTVTLISNDTEKERFKKFGNPEVEAGGSFVDTDILFSLETKPVKIPNQFPLVQKFDGIELGHELARKRAELYAAEMKERIKVKLEEFKALEDDFKGEEVFTI